MDDIVEITLTKDAFECELLTEAVRSEGYQVELVTDMAEAGLTLPGQPSRLLVHAQDVDAVRRIIDASHPLDESGYVSGPNRKLSPRLLNVFRVALVASVLLMILILVQWFGS